MVMPLEERVRELRADTPANAGEVKGRAKGFGRKAFSL
jgi:hypothetical protein